MVKLMQLIPQVSKLVRDIIWPSNKMQFKEGEGLYFHICSIKQNAPGHSCSQTQKTFNFLSCGIDSEAATGGQWSTFALGADALGKQPAGYSSCSRSPSPHITTNTNTKNWFTKPTRWTLDHPTELDTPLAHCTAACLSLNVCVEVECILVKRGERPRTTKINKYDRVEQCVGKSPANCGQPHSIITACFC